MDITVLEQGKRINISGEKNQTVLKLLQDNHIYIDAPCAGKGTCGKCTVKITEGFNESRSLACLTKAADGMEISVEHSKDISVLNVSNEGQKAAKNGAYGLAVDIGTTTIALALADMQSGKIANTYGAINSQRALGADVISRIKAADEGKLTLLNDYIINDLRKGIANICIECELPQEKIQKIYISGNTTMLHILMNVSCRSLGQYPFTPEFIELRELPSEEIFGSSPFSCEVSLLPGISAYVGADLAAGVLHSYSLGGSGKRLLVDLGTNGELALFSEDSVIGTATAAGPAFEGGNISCGMGSVPGAISKAVFNKETASFTCETIGNTAPAGICGSGLLDIAAELVRFGLIDEAGVLDDDYFDEGFPVAEGIFLSQKDIRELQLAKSAVRAGIEILLEENNAGCDDIEKIYLAGGFGHTLNLENAVTLGILPAEWRGKVESIGNSSLQGCICALSSDKDKERLVSFTKSAKEVNLSAHPKFNELFMEYMMFD